MPLHRGRKWRNGFAARHDLDDISASACRKRHRGSTARIRTAAPGLGDEFLDQVAHAMNRLADNPELPLIYYRGFRRSLLQQFPHKLFYRLESSRVIVFRVLHASRDHSRWLSK